MIEVLVGITKCAVTRHHVPHVDFSQCIVPEPDVIVGPVIRYCGRCGKLLEGDVIVTGDYINPADIAALPESHN